MDKHTERDNQGQTGYGKFSEEAKATLAKWAWVMIERALAEERREEQGKDKDQ